MIINISDACKNQPKRLDFDNTINLSSLIVILVESSHTLGGVGRCYVDVILSHTHLNKSQSLGLRQTMSVWVVITDTPVYMCYYGEEEDGEGTVSESLSLLSYTLRYVSLSDLDRVCT
jgi:hypothetical protein